MRPPRGRIARWAGGICLAAGMAAALPAGPAIAATTGTAATAAPYLLLIHGYTDSCAFAFDNAAGSTISYLKSSGGWPAGHVKTVGYYTQDEGSLDGGDSSGANCGVDLNTASAGLGTTASGCATYTPAVPGSAGYGTTNDPIMHLACLFAWYIYDNYTTKGIPVEILTHSMGGLITRAAIGGHAARQSGFPPAPLIVPDVVSVAAPEQGIDPVVYGAAVATGDNQEVEDMFPKSVLIAGGLTDNFMTTMNETVSGAQPYEKPQGQGSTHWALLGSSVPSGPPTATTFQGQACPPAKFGSGWSLAEDLSCAAEGIDADTAGNTLRYPDGDGVVLAASQMGMQADTKVLYGSVEDWQLKAVFAADTSTEYEHEINTCEPLGSVPILGDPSIGTVCTAAPFYLNDNTPPSTTTSAFVCSSSCGKTDFSDIPVGTPTTVPHSLAEIASQLVPPVTAAGVSTYNLPASTEAGGAEYVAYDDTSAAGAVHVAMYTPGLSSVTSWSDPVSSTFIGTGPAVAASPGGVVVAWTDNGTSTDIDGVKAQRGDLLVALLRPSGFTCITDLRTAVQGNGTPLGVSPYSPYLSSEGQDGTGQLFLTWVDTQNHNLHITPVIVNASSSSSACGPFTVFPDTTVNDTNDTSFNGPALAVSGYTGTSGSSGERFWLTWAGNDSGHHINIAEYQPAIGANGFGLALVTKATESAHATDNDMGAAFEPAPGATDGSGTEWMSYCGTNNQVYYQEFTSVAGGTEVAAGQSCTVTLVNSWYSGGAGISYQYSTGLMLLSWALPGSLQTQLAIL